MVPAIVKLFVEVSERVPRTTADFPVNVTLPLLPMDVCALLDAEIAIFRPSAAVRVKFPADTVAFTPVVEDCALMAAAKAPLESLVMSR